MSVNMCLQEYVTGTVEPPALTAARGHGTNGI